MKFSKPNNIYILISISILIILFSLSFSIMYPKLETSNINSFDNQNNLNLNDLTGINNTHILLGSSSALSGHAGFLGTETIKGSKIYFNEINNNGGIYGRKIKLISYDDQYDPSKTVPNTIKLINDDKVFALFDFVGTPTSVKILDIIKQSKTPAVGFFTGANELRNPVNPFLFNIRDSYNSEAEAAIFYFVDKLRYDKVAIFYQDDAFGKTVLKDTISALKKRKLKPVIIDKFTRGTMDIQTAQKNIQNSNAQAVIMVGTYSPLAKFIKISTDNNFTPYFHTVSFIGSGAFSNEIINVQKIDKKYYDKILVTQVVPSPFDNSSDLVKEYRTLLKKYYPNSTVNYVSFEGFINAKVLVEALNLVGEDLTKTKLITSLESMHEYGIGFDEKINFHKFDHQAIDEVYYSKLTNNSKFEIFNPFILNNSSSINID